MALAFLVAVAIAAYTAWTDTSPPEGFSSEEVKAAAEALPEALAEAAQPGATCAASPAPTNKSLNLTGHPYLENPTGPVVGPGLDLPDYVEVVWDHTISLVSIRKDNDEPEGDTRGFGLNLWLGPLEPVSRGFVRENYLAPSGYELTGEEFEAQWERMKGACVSRLVNADFAVSARPSGTPEEMDIHTYVFPEAQQAFDCGLLVITFASKTVLEVEKTCVGLVEMDIFGEIGESRVINGSFTAVEN